MSWSAERTAEFDEWWETLTDSEQRKTMRIFFAFDPTRVTILLVGGDKAGKTKRFYKQMIPKADQIYDAHLRSTAKERKGHGKAEQTVQRPKRRGS
jgi:hypothetical protein